MSKLQGTRWWKRARNSVGQYSLLECFNWQTQDVYPSMAAHAGNFRHNTSLVDEALPRTSGVDVFADDTAKNAVSLATDLGLVASRLRVGSLVVLADFLQPHVVRELVDQLGSDLLKLSRDRSYLGIGDGGPV